MTQAQTPPAVAAPADASLGPAALDPWTWLLGRSPSGAWRHAPFLAPEPGQGQDPAQEPRVEVMRRLIAYPEPAFSAVVRAVARSERPEREARWVCFRDPGQVPTRPYWLCFVSSVPGGRRFHLGLELFDRERLGLWFFSGYQADQVPRELVAPFPGRPELMLPRVELDSGPERFPVAAWVQAAWEDRLGFARDALVAPRGTGAFERHTDQSNAIQASVLAIEPDSDTLHPLLGLRSSRARLTVFLPGAEPAIYPLSRLSTKVGRDPRCDVVVDHPSVSKEHARLEWTPAGAAIRDLSSKNGTTVAGARLLPESPRPLAGEVRLLLGQVPALLVVDTAPPPEGTPHPHAQRLELLGRQGKLAPEACQAAEAEAKEHGVTPGEVALLRGWIALDDWLKPAGGGCAGLLLLAATLTLAGCALGFR